MILIAPSGHFRVLKFEAVIISSENPSNQQRAPGDSIMTCRKPPVTSNKIHLPMSPFIRGVYFSNYIIYF